MEVIAGLAQILKRPSKTKLHGGKSITQPDMTISIAKVLERSRLGMAIQGYEPIYYGTKNPELIGFENLSKLEQIEFAREFKKAADDQMQQAKTEALERAKALDDQKIQHAVFDPPKTQTN